MSSDQDIVALDAELPLLKRLASFIKDSREHRGWSQQNLAEFVGVSRDVIKRLEAGDGDARCSIVFRILPLLDATAEDLMRIMFGQVGANRRKHV